METSILFARIMGPAYLIAALHLFLYRKNVQKVMDEYMESEAAMFYGGVAALVVGLIIVNVHNVWDGDWPVIITLIGWIGLVKGAMALLWPRAMKNFSEYFRKGSGMIAFGGLVAVLLGGYLTYAGYFM